MFLLNYTTFVPHYYHLTFPAESYALTLSEELIRPEIIEKECYLLGRTHLRTTPDNKVWAYDRERTVLDMIAKYTMLDGLVKEMLVDYLEDEKKDLEKLSEYARKMGRSLPLDLKFTKKNKERNQLLL